MPNFAGLALGCQASRSDSKQENPKCLIGRSNHNFALPMLITELRDSQGIIGENLIGCGKSTVDPLDFGDIVDSIIEDSVLKAKILEICIVVHVFVLPLSQRIQR